MAPEVSLPLPVPICIRVPHTRCLPVLRSYIVRVPDDWVSSGKLISGIRSNSHRGRASGDFCFLRLDVNRTHLVTKRPAFMISGNSRTFFLGIKECEVASQIAQVNGRASGFEFAERYFVGFQTPQVALKNYS
jgi:hypothetical protein